MSLIETEYLFWVPDSKTELGVMPGFYERVTTEADRRALVDMGGIDVSPDHRAWIEYQRQFESAALSTA